MSAFTQDFITPAGRQEETQDRGHGRAGTPVEPRRYAVHRRLRLYTARRHHRGAGRREERCVRRRRVRGDATAAAGTTPTKAEFDAVVTELNETKKKLNAALASLKAPASSDKEARHGR